MNKIRIESRKLNSGRYQVKFYVMNKAGNYGYLLAEPKTTLKEVVHKINSSLTERNEFNYLNLNQKTNSEIILF